MVTWPLLARRGQGLGKLNIKKMGVKIIVFGHLTVTVIGLGLLLPLIIWGLH